MASLGDGELIRNALKRALQAAGLTYSDVAARVGVSEVTIKRRLGSDTMSIQQIEEICSIVGLSLLDILDMARAEGDQALPHFTLEQEKALSEDLALALTRLLVWSGWTVDDIKDEYGVEDSVIIQLLAKLDRLGIIDLLPMNRIHYKLARDAGFSQGGPMARVMAYSVHREIKHFNFFDKEQTFLLHPAELSDASVAQMQDMLRSIVRKFRQLRDADRKLPRSEKNWVSVFMMMKPNTWYMELGDKTLTPKSVRHNIDQH